MKFLIRSAVLTSTCALVFTTVPAPAADKVELKAEVASSVKAPFEQFIKIYQTKHPNVTITAKYGGGADIQNDVESDNPIDIVVVGKNQTDKVTAHINSPVAVLTNREVVIVPKNGAKVKSLKDLANPGVRVAMGAAGSAVGTLARQMLKNASADPAYGADFAEKVRANTAFQAASEEEVVNSVESGKADAAIGFVSSVDPLKFQAVVVPDNVNVNSVYYIFVPKSAKNAAMADDMVKLMSGKQGQTILHSYRYLPPPKA